jgi:hypothetical protein
MIQLRSGVVAMLIGVSSILVACSSAEGPDPAPNPSGENGPTLAPGQISEDITKGPGQCGGVTCGYNARCCYCPATSPFYFCEPGGTCTCP